MNRQQIILVVISILVITVIYRLPRVVVENETSSEMEPHDLRVSAEDELRLGFLRESFSSEKETKKSINFADSLAMLFLKYQLVDSAVKYGSYILSRDSFALEAGLIYYQAFQSALSAEEAKEYAEVAGRVFEKLLESDPDNSSLKNKLGMTLMVTQNPMAGVQLLRQVLEAEPQNREALLNLGLLAIQSGQYDRAIERFDKLSQLDSTDYEATFYKGVALSESGDNEQAQIIFQKLVDNEKADAALRATAANYKEEL